MLFNFFLANHLSGGLKGMPDLVQPIFHGLVEAGHEVIGFGLGLQGAPAVNVLVEFFPDDAFSDNLLRLKAQSGDKFVFGILCTEDIEDALVMQQPEFPRRRANLERLLPAADFVWTLLPQVAAYEALAGRGKVALLEYGFSERFLNHHLLADPRLRDVDVLMYGNETPHRAAVIGELRRRGFNCLASDRQVLPEFITSDILRRSKIVLDVRRGAGVRFPSPTRICKAVHSGALVVAEDLGASPIANLYRYAVPCPYAELADRCASIIGSGQYADQGMAALTRFRAETSMRANIIRALGLPAFRRVQAASGSP
jgi:hypothetical protein